MTKSPEECAKKPIMGDERSGMLNNEKKEGIKYSYTPSIK